MAEFPDCPLRRGVTLSTVGAEEALMPIFCLVAARAVQKRFLGLQMLRRKVRRVARLFEPALCLRYIRHRLRRLRLRLLQADPRERDVIHFCGA